MKLELAKVASAVTRTCGKTNLVLKKHSPEILTGLGIAGFIGTVVLASRATLKAGAIIEAHKDAIEEINLAIELEKKQETVKGYVDQIAPREKIITTVRTVGEFAKLYGPAVGTGVLSIACILEAHHIMKARYIGAVAAFNAVSEAFSAYRKRVVDEEGVDADRHYRYGTERATITESVVDDEGKKVKQKVETENIETTNIPEHDFTRVFDCSNANWDRNPTFNLMFLRGQQAVCNNILHTRGHIFLNEVYDYLGFDAVPEGQVVGWYDKDGDGFVDFGLDHSWGSVQRFVNGNPQSIVLDFNHDGVVFDKL